MTDTKMQIYIESGAHQAATVACNKGRAILNENHADQESTKNFVLYLKEVRSAISDLLDAKIKQFESMA